MTGWLAARLTWPDLEKRSQAQRVRHLQQDLAPEVRRWHYLWHAEGGMHLRLRLCCRGEASRQRVWAQLRRAVPGAVQQEYRPEYWKFGGARHYPLHERFFQASSERALAVWDLETPDARMRAAYVDAAHLLRCLGPARTEAHEAMTRFARTHLSDQPGVTRAATALREATLPLAWAPDWPEPGALGANLQGLHLHLNRLGLGLRSEALVYLAVCNPPATLPSGD
ncbi:thiopeptide-type bacteriocin biosynthesis protein [Deinococcus sedimenti]|uniref:Thiopeptide-type bacteriocin biosynthesis domain-containing protein n=1 Tax=Deinococcus sedimenti TaxID=1867090 RepID=A0ABQ2S162_9DEIO|nr:thiopeptide-type bacteriocin biosynthesis protein [Deinococcus sedimenti]GGR78304.1 hypothetical protein GCM10008960_01360 [Deinococcus sedimenti]